MQHSTRAHLCPGAIIPHGCQQDVRHLRAPRRRHWRVKVCSCEASLWQSSSRNTCCPEGWRVVCRRPAALTPLHGHDKRQRVLCRGLTVPLPSLQPVHTSFGTAGLWAAIVACATAAVVAAVVAACLICLRPVFKTLQQTVKAFEVTAKELEKAARGVERATLVFQLDVPHTLSSVERAGHEIGSLAQGFNLTGGGKDKEKEKKSKKKVDRSKGIPQEGDERMPELLGRHGMQRVVQDISTMTNALLPSMDLWRKRLSDLTNAFERASKQEPPDDNNPSALWNMVSANAGQDSSKDSQSLREQSQTWIDEWRKLTTGAADPAANGSEPSPDTQKGMKESVASLLAKSTRSDDEDAGQPVEVTVDEFDDESDDDEGGIPAQVSSAGDAVKKAGDQTAEAAEDALSSAKQAVTQDAEASPKDPEHRDLGLSEEDQLLLDRMLASQDVAHSVLEALARAQAATAAAVVASEDLEEALARARAGKLLEAPKEAEQEQLAAA
ncbi:hypothetical protein WJX73_008547 [Symbiochloris irregularis]|uniref:Uncharacterized protein n=1 Tax=Symbiochloris irregularis TaxID=706552 RepID=A0AAW1P0K2_9CHLO